MTAHSSLKTTETRRQGATSLKNKDEGWKLGEELGDCARHPGVTGGEEVSSRGGGGRGGEGGEGGEDSATDERWEAEV